MRRAAAILAASLSLFAVVVAIALVGDLVSGDDTTATGTTVGALVLALLLAGGFGVLSWQAFRPTRFEQTEEGRRAERCVLDAAKANGGVVTVATVAVHCRLTVAEGQSVLERLTRQGIAEPGLTDGGTFEYRFPGLT